VPKPLNDLNEGAFNSAMRPVIFFSSSRLCWRTAAASGSPQEEQLELTPASGLTVWQEGQLTVTGFEVVSVLIRCRSGRR
jgi:hypothetical protein